MREDRILPQVSIIIPVYNVEQYLEECLESVVGQTLRDIEIICVNDGSTDGSLSILERFAGKDRRLKVISKPNAGYGHTMNVGLNAAAGEYVGIVESDDYVPHDMYETLLGIARAHDLDFIKADFYRFTRENGQLKLEYNDLSRGKKQYYGKVLDPSENIEVFKFIMNTWSGIYKRAFLEQYHIRHNETPGASYQDNGFFFQTFCRARRVWFLDRPFYMNRRDNPNSSIKSREKVFCMRDEYEYIRTFLESEPALKDKFLHIYWYKKYSNYWATYKRIAEEHRPMFLEHFTTEFKTALEHGELDKALFEPDEWQRLELIMHAPQKILNKAPARSIRAKRFSRMVRERGLARAVTFALKSLFSRG
jgi:glycosyltransferase involved in cell wall biosynthesis